MDPSKNDSRSITDAIIRTDDFDKIGLLPVQQRVSWCSLTGLLAVPLMIGGGMASLQAMTMRGYGCRKPKKER